MKIIIDAGKKKELIKLGNETVLCILGRNFPIMSYKKFLKEIGEIENDIYISENIKKRLSEKIFLITEFKKINTAEIFLKNIEKIVRHIKTEEKITISIHSDKKDERIFNLISSLNTFCSVIHLITEDENFYEDVLEYTLLNFGLAVNLKKSAPSSLNIILNSEITDFSDKNGYVINLSYNELTAQKILDDILPLNLPKDLKTDIKKCVFLEKDCQKFDLIWKNSQKGVDKSEK